MLIIIEIADDWVENAIAEEEFVMSMLERPEHMQEGKNDENDISSEPEHMDTSTSDDCNLEPTKWTKEWRCSSKTSDPVSHYANVLESFAREHGLRVHDVPRDGNCLFSSVAYQLQNRGHDVNLRQMVISYLSENGDVYSPLVHQSVASNDRYNADNEAPGEEDAYIESITDPDV